VQALLYHVYTIYFNIFIPRSTGTSGRTVTLGFHTKTFCVLLLSLLAKLIIDKEAAMGEKCRMYDESEKTVATF
jgi:hypothetical protein